MVTQHFLSHLEERGLVAQVTHRDELEDLLSHAADRSKLAVYCGFDPTARSLHVGHLLQLIALRRAQDCGLTPIVLFGGATGLVGDPTGRTEMRPMSSEKDIQEAVKNYQKLVQRYFRMDVPNKPIFVNNLDWFGKMTWIEFARNVGVHFTIARLLASEFSKARLENGLTFMELSYQLMQSYDFLMLFEKYHCVLQIGGNDQWSNVLAGADLIRRKESKKAFALTLPLLAGSDGKKYGKTAGNAIWIDPDMLPPYEFFQFFRNIADADVEMMYRFMTYLPLGEIKSLFEKEKNINALKEKLAYEMTMLVHGQEEAEKALASARALFAGGAQNLDSLPFATVSESRVSSGALEVTEAFVIAGLCASKGEARRLIQGGGLSLNGNKITDIKQCLKVDDFVEANRSAILRKGKKDYFALRIEG